MRKLVAVACAVIGLSFVACGGSGDATAPTPVPSYEPGAAPAYQNGNSILGPAGKARNTVDQLDQQQQQTEDQTGGGALVPEAYVP